MSSIMLTGQSLIGFVSDYGEYSYLLFSYKTTATAFQQTLLCPKVILGKTNHVISCLLLAFFTYGNNHHEFENLTTNCM